MEDQRQRVLKSLEVLIAPLTEKKFDKPEQAMAFAVVEEIFINRLKRLSDISQSSKNFLVVCADLYVAAMKFDEVFRSVGVSSFSITLPINIPGRQKSTLFLDIQKVLEGLSFQDSLRLQILTALKIYADSQPKERSADDSVIEVWINSAASPEMALQTLMPVLNENITSAFQGKGNTSKDKDLLVNLEKTAKSVAELAYFEHDIDQKVRFQRKTSRTAEVVTGTSDDQLKSEPGSPTVVTVLPRSRSSRPSTPTGEKQGPKKNRRRKKDSETQQEGEEKVLAVTPPTIPASETQTNHDDTVLQAEKARQERERAEAEQREAAQRLVKLQEEEARRAAEAKVKAEAEAEAKRKLEEQQRQREAEERAEEEERARKLSEYLLAQDKKMKEEDAKKKALDAKKQKLQNEKEVQTANLKELSTRLGEIDEAIRSHQESLARVNADIGVAKSTVNDSMQRELKTKREGLVPFKGLRSGRVKEIETVGTNYANAKDVSTLESTVSALANTGIYYFSLLRSLFSSSYDARRKSFEKYLQDCYAAQLVTDKLNSASDDDNAAQPTLVEIGNSLKASLPQSYRTYMGLNQPNEQLLQEGVAVRNSPCDLLEVRLKSKKEALGQIGQLRTERERLVAEQPKLRSRLDEIDAEFKTLDGQGAQKNQVFSLVN